jgi:hydroxymethylbilane synthase
VSDVTERSALRLATRGSPLALWQAGRIAGLLDQVGVDTSVVVVETTGDQRTDVPLDRIGGQGVFVKEVQSAVLRGDADAAVHSAKDLPASGDHGVPGLTLAAFPERADARDVLVGAGLGSLPTGSMVATGSARRRAQLANLRPDLAFTGLRGNLATRLGAVGEGGVTAVVVAKAALDRLGWSPPEGLDVEVLGPEVVLPQVGQGALAVECRPDDEVTLRALTAIDDSATRRLVVAERSFLAELGGGCTLPVGAHAVGAEAVGGSITDGVGGGGVLSLTGMLASADGRIVLRYSATGDQPEAVGLAVARYLLHDAGGGELGDWERPTGEADHAGAGVRT